MKCVVYAESLSRYDGLMYRYNGPLSRYAVKCAAYDESLSRYDGLMCPYNRPLSRYTGTALRTMSYCLNTAD
jgi:hypothetical protein